MIREIIAYLSLSLIQTSSIHQEFAIPLTKYAKCDDVTDDSLAIQLAFNNSSISRPVLLPYGTCKFSSTLTIADGLSVIGLGPNKSKLLYSGAGTALSSESRVNFVKLEGFK